MARNPCRFAWHLRRVRLRSGSCRNELLDGDAKQTRKSPFVGSETLAGLPEFGPCVKCQSPHANPGFRGYVKKVTSLREAID
jgi:hypothetical protein